MRKTIFRMVALLCIGGTHMLSATAQTSDAVNATKLADSNSTFISESSHGEDDELQVVDNMPEFPGGNQALMAYLKNNIKYPTICQRQGIQGRVIIQFVINTDGSITNIQVVEPVNPHLDKEALRVVSGMPKWKPGSHEGKLVRVRFTLPVTFRLNEAAKQNALADDNSAFTFTESQLGEDDEMPEFPGGNQALMAYLKNNINYPTICQRQGIQGRVIIQFVINTDGSITNIQVVEPVNPHLDKEALRVVSGMPKWKPGSHEGKLVRVRFTLPVTFRLNETAKQNALADDNSAFTFTESQLGEDDDAVQSVAALTSSTNDIYLSNVGYLFSPMRFKVRGYDSKYNDVYINGVQMNDMETGRFSYGMVGGLNHATKNQEGVSPFEDNRFAYAPIGGASNINMRASQYATGSNLTFSACNRNYLTRAIFTHSTGLLDNGWAMTFSLAHRWANEGVIEGTFYNSFSYFLSVQKVFNPQHSLSFSFWQVPTQRAQQGAATEETYALAGSHYYNPYWGYQNGVKRNARVVNTFEPTGIVTWDFDIDEYRKLTTTAAMKYSQYGTTALGWNGNAADPRPDYYKKLPSSAYNVWDLDYSPTADEVSSYMDIYDHFTSAKANRQIDWDMMYFANQQGNAQGLDALYYVEERHNDQAALNLSSTWSHTINNYNRYNLGLNASTTKGMHYKTMSDLLGANSYTDIDKFAARDNGLTNPIIQNDLRNPNRQISEGDVFGYNYNIYVNKARAWGQYLYTYGPLRAVVSGQINGTTIERDGLMQNGRAAERSYGSSGVAKFLGGGGKATLSWRINPSNVLTLNSSYQREAPLAYNSFVANRIKNDFVHGLSTEGIFNNELSYSLTTARFTARLSGYYTRFTDQVEQTAFYNDSEARFTYLTMRGVEKEHYGIEAAAIWNVTSALSFTFIGSMGDALYTNNPYATITYESQDEVSMTYTNPVTKKQDALLVIADGCRVSSTPLTALSLGIDYNVNGWFFGANVNYYDRVYVDFSEFRRLSNILTPYISSGAVDANGNPSFGVDEATLATNGGILYNEDGSIYKAQTAEQTRVKGGFLVDLNVGRYIRLKNGRSLSLNLTVNNLLNNTNMSTGGYEQNRGDYYYDNGEQSDARTYVFSKNPKLYYANAFNAFFNVAYKF